MNVIDAKAPSIGSKLLGISKFQMLNGSNKDADSSSEDILLKVEEILLSCKEIKPLDRDDKRTTRPELCSKWLALLTMEKACLSAVALEGKFSNQISFIKTIKSNNKLNYSSLQHYMDDFVWLLFHLLLIVVLFRTWEYFLSLI